MLRNEMLANLYKESLLGETKRIPKKFLPNFSQNEPIEIKNLKLNTSLQATENEIQTMLIHKDLQEKRMQMYENKIIAHINSHELENKRVTLFNDYENIVRTANTRIEKKLSEKMSYFNSNVFMTTIKYFKSKFPQETISYENTKNDFFTTNNNVYSKQNHNEREDTDIDDVDVETMPLLENTNQPQIVQNDKSPKRKAPNSIPSCHSDDEINRCKARKAKPIFVSQPVRKTTNIPISKNLNTTAKNTKMKTHTQQS